MVDNPTTAAAAGTPNAAPSADVKAGVGAFVDPGDMDIESWHELQFVVAPNALALAQEAEDQQMKAERAIYVAPTMRVTLLPSPDFEIREKTPALQATGNDLAATWLWSVRPLRSGEDKLEARVEVGQTVNGQFVVADSYTRHVPIKVTVGTWKGFLNGLQNASSLGDALGTLFNSWGKTVIALTALIGAIGGLWLAIRKWGKDRQVPAP